jgi:hypothetical protein
VRGHYKTLQTRKKRQRPSSGKRQQILFSCALREGGGSSAPHIEPERASDMHCKHRASPFKKRLNSPQIPEKPSEPER